MGLAALVTDQNDAVIATFDYYPFGLLMPERYTINNNTIEKFTGKQLDEGLGLYYFGMRYYDPAYGQWTTFEPILKGNPKKLIKKKKYRLFSFSPYNYALNNSMKFTDPDGACPVCWDIVDFGMAGLSIKDAWQDPSWSNAGWAALDVAAAGLPFVPSSRYFRMGAKLFSKAGDTMGRLPRFTKSTINDAQGLIGKDFENFL